MLFLNRFSCQFSFPLFQVVANKILFLALCLQQLSFPVPPKSVLQEQFIVFYGQ